MTTLKSRAGAISAAALLDPASGGPIATRDNGDGTYSLAIAGGSATPLLVPLANGNNVVWDGPHRLVALVSQGGPGAAVTVTIRDTTGGNISGGTALEQVIIPANSAPFRVDINQDMVHGCVINLSAEANAYALIEGVPNAPIGPSDGALIFEFGAAATSVTRVTTHAVNTDTAFIKQGDKSYRVVGNTNPVGDIVVGWNSASVPSLVPITPADMFQCLVVDVYVVAPGQRYANGTFGDGLGARMQVRIDDGAGNQFDSEYLDVCQGWNRLVFPRQNFTTGAGAPSFGTHTFTTFNFRLNAGTTGTPEFYLDRMAINCGSASPIQFMIDLDDGFDPDDLFTQQMMAFPLIKVNQFLCVDFSAAAGNPTYASFSKWRELQQKLGEDRLYLGWHSKTHSGPTAMETMTQSQVETDEIAPWITQAQAAGIKVDEIHGATPNGQDSANMRAAFTTYKFVSNRTVRAGVSHPKDMEWQPFSMRQLYISDTSSYANLAAHLKVLQQTRCMGVFLTHSWSQENASGTPVSGAVTTLNLKKTETETILGTLSAYVRAGLAICLLRPSYKEMLNIP